MNLSAALLLFSIVFQPATGTSEYTMHGAVLLSLVKNVFGQVFDFKVVFGHPQNLDNEMFSQLLWSTAILQQKR